MIERLSKLKRLVRDFARKWFKLMKRYDNFKDIIEFEKSKDKEEEELLEEFRRKVETLGFECEIVMESKSYNYLHIPDWPRDRNFYDIFTLLARVFDPEARKAYNVCIHWEKREEPYTIHRKLKGIVIDEIPMVSREKTPITYEIIETIPWDLIRPRWKSHIEEIINELATAEVKGLDCLKRALIDMMHRVKIEVRRIPENQYLYEALVKTYRKLKKALRRK